MEIKKLDFAILFSSLLFVNTVITGFNTDIEYQGITYHVQTEDKGLDTPLILSLVYNRGTILASKRSPYDDLISEGFDEKVLVDRLQKQHKLICAAVRAGRIEDLKRMTMKESALKQKKLIAQKEIKSPVDLKENISREAALPAETKQVETAAADFIKTEDFIEEVLKPLEQAEKSKPEAVLSPIEEQTEAEPQKQAEEAIVWEAPLNVLEEPIIEAVQIIEEETILPADAVEIIAEAAKLESPPDNKLKLGLLTDTNFKGGERKTINIMVWRGTMEDGLNGAHILVKIVGTTFRPLIFHAKTDSNGIATIHLQLPHFRAGRAAILIKAMNEGEEAELRRIISQG